MANSQPITPVARDAQNDLTEGEYYICNYLKEKDITYKTQVKIENLVGDDRSYRVADFFLPEYKMYIEYLGQWNKHEEAKSRYRQKKYVYSINNIPCVYLYPENLGILDFLFDARIKYELKKHNLKKELFRYKWDRLVDDRGELFFYIILCLVMLFIGDYETDPSTNFQYISFFSLVSAYQLFRLYRGYVKFFVRDKTLRLQIKNN